MKKAIFILALMTASSAFAESFTDTALAPIRTVVRTLTKITNALTGNNDLLPMRQSAADFLAQEGAAPEGLFAMYIHERSQQDPNFDNSKISDYAKEVIQAIDSENQ